MASGAGTRPAEEGDPGGRSQSSQVWVDPNSCCKGKREVNQHGPLRQPSLLGTAVQLPSELSLPWAQARNAGEQLECEVPGWAGKLLSVVLSRIPQPAPGECAALLIAPSNWVLLG